MYSSRLLHGVLQVVTTSGVRYLRASFLQRLYLLWTFRNFPMLPEAVLNRRQRRLLEMLLVRRRPENASVELVDCPVIGIIDRSESRAGIFGVAHQLPATGCNQPAGLSSRRG